MEAKEDNNVAEVARSLVEQIRRMRNEQSGRRRQMDPPKENNKTNIRAVFK